MGSLEGAEVAPPSTTPTTAEVAPPATTAEAAPEDQGPLGARLTRKVSLRSAPDGKMIGTLETKTRWGSPRVLAVTERRDGWLGTCSQKVEQRTQPIHIITNRWPFSSNLLW